MKKEEKEIDAKREPAEELPQTTPLNSANELKKALIIDKERNSENIPPKKNLKRVRFSEPLVSGPLEKLAKRSRIELAPAVPKQIIPPKELKYIRCKPKPSYIPDSTEKSLKRSLKPSVSALDLLSAAKPLSRKRSELPRTKGSEYEEKFYISEETAESIRTHNKFPIFFRNSAHVAAKDTAPKDIPQNENDSATTPTPAQKLT